MSGVVVPPVMRLSVAPESWYRMVVSVQVDKGQVGRTRHRGDGLGGPELPGDQLERGAIVLLHFDPVGANEVRLLALHLDQHHPGENHAEHRRHHEQLGQGESPLVPEDGAQPTHRWAISILTATERRPDTALAPVALSGR